MKPLLTLGILFVIYVSSLIILHKTSMFVHNSVYSPNIDEQTTIRHAGGQPGYPVISHARTFTIGTTSHSIPTYNTIYDCNGHRVKFLDSNHRNVWQNISKNSDEEVIFEYACYTER